MASSRPAVAGSCGEAQLSRYARPARAGHRGRRESRRARFCRVRRVCRRCVPNSCRRRHACRRPPRERPGRHATARHDRGKARRRVALALPRRRVPAGVDPARRPVRHRDRRRGQSGRADARRLPADGPTRPATGRPWSRIHGGGFRAGTKNNPNVVDLATAFRRRGYVAVSINYRLLAAGVVCGGTTPTPPQCVGAAVAARDDAQVAIQWLRANAKRLRIDPHRIAAGGTSAGAVTSLLLATRPSDRSTAIGAAVSISGSLPGGQFTPAPTRPTLFFHGTARHDRTITRAGKADRRRDGRGRHPGRVRDARGQPGTSRGSTAAASSRQKRVTSSTTICGSTGAGARPRAARSWPGRGLAPGPGRVQFRAARLAGGVRRASSTQLGRLRRVEVAGAAAMPRGAPRAARSARRDQSAALASRRAAAEDAVDEPRRVGAAVLLASSTASSIATSTGTSSLGAAPREGGPQDAALQRRDPVERPALGCRAISSSSSARWSSTACGELPGEGPGVREQLLQRTTGDVVLVEGEDAPPRRWRRRSPHGRRLGAGDVLAAARVDADALALSMKSGTWTIDAGLQRGGLGRRRPRRCRPSARARSG